MRSHAPIMLAIDRDARRIMELHYLVSVES
jgi:hypothetical protein